MLEYDLRGSDLAAVRFAISPVNELAFSLRTWRDPGRFPLHLPWLTATQHAREGLDGELLIALTNVRLGLPDFLTPRPRTPMERLESELDLIAATPLDVVRADFAEVHPEGLPGPLRGPTARVLGRVVAALADCWTVCLEPWWPRMRAVLEADVVHRGRTTARAGIAAMFADLSPDVSLDGDVVRASGGSTVVRRRVTAGEGLTLLPSLFTHRAAGPFDPGEAPILVYPARGTGTVWQAERTGGPAALAALVGEVRAGLLAVLESPASSTELAVRLGVTTSAVNQHLRALRAAGWLTSARHGRSVLYLRSELGDALVAGALDLADRVPV
jgi:DNA-binding transcriptional ArsR family regulator